MRNTFLSARLVSEDLIRLSVFSEISFDSVEVTLIIDDEKRWKLVPDKKVSLPSQLIIDYKFEKPLELGHSYRLEVLQYGIFPLDVSEASTFPSFDEEYAYDGSDLGANYSKEETIFALWAPLSSSVSIEIQKENEKEPHFYKLTRGEKGVYRLALKGDYERARYLYHLITSEIHLSSIDPYAKCSTLNGERSVVADFKKLHRELYSSRLPAMNSYCDAIIYEGHVRDLTIDPSANIENKGTFLGLAERGRKTSEGKPAGFDYLASLGFTHLQLQPIQDYGSVDEKNPFSSYNWGYDPVQYFVPEGSYASSKEDPYSRISDCLTMISAFHKEGIRIVMDVVYNHVYEYQSTSFEKIVPNYYFRRRGNGKLANTSGCGNDLASERAMVRKLIVDSAKWWIDYYEIDGFRFDLSGIITVSAINEIIAYGKKKNPYFMAYGEGWNMGGEVDSPLATMDNYRLLPDYAFFNDKYREAIKRYANGDLFATDEAKFAFAGSSFDFCGGKKMFFDARGSLNYVECHDNGTYFDYLSKHDGGEEETILRKCLFAEALILTSFGIPFIHAGEEVGQSKWLNENTYNAPDWYNRLSYKLIDERSEMVDYLRALIVFRKKTRFLHSYDPRHLDHYLDIKNEGDLLCVYIKGEENASPYKEIHLFYNPTGVELTHTVEKKEVTLFGKSGKYVATSEKKVVIPSFSFIATALPR